MFERLHVRKNLIVCLGGFALAVFAVKGFYDTSAAYSNFNIALGVGTLRIHIRELVFYSWYFLYGTIAIIGFTVSLANTVWVEKLSASVLALVQNRRLFVGAVMIFAFVAVLLVRLFILLDAPIADDESTYVFIAKTLLQGRIVNPLPEEPRFYTNQFVILNEQGWYGKYPIGHPLVLAVGIATKTLVLTGPILAALTVLLSFLVGEKIFGKTVASLGILLLAVSPHFIATWATLLSQTSSTVCMLVGIYTLMRLQDERRWQWALATGCAFGFGILVRPLPGLLFLLVAAIVFFIPLRGESFRRHLKSHAKNFLLALVPLFLVAVILLWVNEVQTGTVSNNAYRVSAGAGMGLVTMNSWQKSVSVGASLLRQNFWLLGVPLSLLFLAFARCRRTSTIFWGMLVAEYAYRLFVPKTCVASTGPIYVTEIVPLLATGVAAGIVNVTRWVTRNNLVGQPNKWAVSLIGAITLTALYCFWPVQGVILQKGATAWNATSDMLKQKNIKKAVVFTMFNVHPNLKLNWAYYPPNNSPSLDDDVIYVRLTPEITEKDALLFGKKHYSDRILLIAKHDDQGVHLFPLQ